MLRYKIKEMLLFLDKREPLTYLMKTCGFSKLKANALLNNGRDSVKLADIEVLCKILNCTPNDLMWWDNNVKTRLSDNHNLIAKLEPPDKDPAWSQKFASLSIDEIKKIKHYVDDLKMQKAEAHKAKMAENEKKKESDNQDSAINPK